MPDAKKVLCIHGKEIKVGEPWTEDQIQACRYTLERLQRFEGEVAFLGPDYYRLLLTKPGSLDHA